MEIVINVKTEDLSGAQLYEVLQGITPQQCKAVANLAVDDHLGSIDDDTLYIYRSE